MGDFMNRAILRTVFFGFLVGGVNLLVAMEKQTLLASEKPVFKNLYEHLYLLGQEKKGVIGVRVFETTAPVVCDVMMHVICREIKVSDGKNEVYFFRPEDTRSNADIVLEIPVNKKNKEKVEGFDLANRFFLEMATKLFAMPKEKEKEKKRPVYEGLTRELLMKEKKVRICYITLPVYESGLGGKLGYEGFHPDEVHGRVFELMNEVEKKLEFNKCVAKNLSVQSVYEKEKQNMMKVAFKYEQFHSINRLPLSKEELMKQFNCSDLDEGYRKELLSDEDETRQKLEKVRIDNRMGIRFVVSGGDCSDVVSILAEKIPFCAFNISPRFRKSLVSFGSLLYPLKHYGFVVNFLKANAKTLVDIDKSCSNEKGEIPNVLTMGANYPLDTTTFYFAINMLCDEKFF